MGYYPNYELKISKNISKDSLSGIGAGVGIFKNYKHYCEQLDTYELKSDNWQAIRAVKVDFQYDYMMGKVKEAYFDEFKRCVTVTKL